MSEDHSQHLNDHAQHNCQCHKANTAVQSLDELDFDRGIWSAALYNDLDRLQSLIERGDVNRRDNSCYTALHYAARKNHLEACRILLAAGADVNAQTKGGVTPLHRACSMGCDSVVTLLLRRNANTSIRDSDGNTALHRATAGGHVHIARQLVDHDPRLLTHRNGKNASAWDLVSAERHDEFQGILGDEVKPSQMSQ